MTNTPPTIALLMDHFLTVYQTTIRDAIRFEAKSRNLNLLCVIGRALDSPLISERIQNEIFNDVTASSVQGIIVTGTTLSAYAGKDRVDEFCSQFTLPICNIGLQLSAVPSVILNNVCFSSIVEHLARDHNCKRIAFIGGPKVNEEAELRRLAFLEGLKMCGLTYYPELEKTGQFTLQSGYEAATQLMNEKASFDALVVANDNMAVGAMGVLKARGLKIPEDVRITGFDDTLAARFHQPPLTTMRQPLELMGRQALDLVLRQIDGETVPLITEVNPVLYCRQSCGCDSHRGYLKVQSFHSSALPLVEVFEEKRKEIAETLEKNIQLPKELFGNWIERVLSALEQEFSGQSGRMLALLYEILADGGWRRWLLDELQSAVSLLKQYFPHTLKSEIDLERFWHAVQMFLCDASAKEQMRQQVDADLASKLFLQRAAADLPARLTRKALVESIVAEIESIGIVNAAVMVFEDEAKEKLALMAAIKDGTLLNTKGVMCHAKDLLPEPLKSSGTKGYAIVPLSLGGDRFGRMVLELGAPDLYYEMLREHLSSYLKSIASHERTIAQLKAIADARKQELEIQHRQKLESLGVLAGGIAHDFNNMLSVMLGNLDVTLLELGTESPLHDIVLECKAVSKHAAKLCRQLLAYSGKGNFIIKRINLNNVVYDLEDLLMLSVSKNAKLILDLQENLPDIEGDVSQLNQIFMNLIINASDSMGEDDGTIMVRTTCEQKSEAYLQAAFSETDLSPGEYVLIAVKDTGCGIDKENLEQIFDPFFTTNYSGKGLGLAAVMGIVRNHRGAIHVTSDVGKGTQFEILFPPLPRISEAPSVSSVPPQITGHGTVLLVDDEPTVLRTGERLLKRLDFNVLLSKDGQQAIDLFQERECEITCVILDISMPGMGGIAIMEQIRKIRADVPIILSCGYAEAETMEAIEGGERTVFLQKPYDFAGLSGVLGSLLNMEDR